MLKNDDDLPTEIFISHSIFSVAAFTNNVPYINTIHSFQRYYSIICLAKLAKPFMNIAKIQFVHTHFGIYAIYF